MAATATERLRRHSRRARLLHAAVYLTTIPALFTGWWILASRGGALGRLFGGLGAPDARLHVWLGRAMTLALLGCLAIGRRRILSFARQTLRVDRGDGRWLARWPAATLTGRFARHEGKYDPGQRAATVVMVGGLVTLTGTGVAMTLLHGGPTFAWLTKVHRWTTFAVTPFVLGHILIGLGVLPGYRGVWRAVHLGGRLRETTARRLWPGWAERELGEPHPETVAARHRRVDTAAPSSTDRQDADAGRESTA